MKRFILLTCLIISISFLEGCKFKENVRFTEQEVATQWADMTLFITRNTPANSPTYASRALGYIGVTMYESVISGFDKSKSLGNQLNGLGAMPAPIPDKEYSWIISLNAGQAEILRQIYNQTSEANKLKIDSLENVIYDSFSESVDEDVNERSVTYGKQVAKRIFEWSISDGGHRGYLKNFDKEVIYKHGKGTWKPPLLGQTVSRFPLHPHWGENRTFVISNATLPVPEFTPYSTAPESEYYKQFLTVYEKSKTLTQAEKETSLWWGDDPSDTFTPPGHSYNLGTIAIRKYNPPLLKCVETYARIGIAVADAFINCWKLKYTFFSERPSTFVAEHIDPMWEPFWPDPPFPAFPSGHATQGSSTSTVLADLYGEQIELFDNSHEGHTRNEFRNLDYKSRGFTSFLEIAKETADSRFYGGIHTQQDNLVGLDQGKKIGDNINILNWAYANNDIATK